MESVYRVEYEVAPEIEETVTIKDYLQDNGLQLRSEICQPYECCLCLTPCAAPFILDCNHWHCQQCVQNTYVKKNDNRVSCSQCRQETLILNVQSFDSIIKRSRFVVRIF
jgi:hypothetical protein